MTLESFLREAYVKWRWVDGIGDYADLERLLRLAYEQGRQDGAREIEHSGDYE